MDWFLNLSVAEKIYFIIAIVASILLVIQIVIMLFSLGGGDFDMDDVLTAMRIRTAGCHFSR